MRARLAAAVVTFALLSGSAAAQNTVERVAIKGAQDMIVVPKDWNGGLFLYAHGYTADKRILAPLPADPSKVPQLLGQVTAIEQQVKKVNFTLLVRIKNQLDSQQQEKLRALRPAHPFGPPGGPPP